MQTSAPLIQFTIGLPATDYAAYQEAMRLLKRVMGKHAPNLVSLIVFTLRCRDGRGVAEDYLESVDWPVTLPKRSKQPRGNKRPSLIVDERVSARFSTVDFSRN
jgi:hypothetical protein